MEALEPAWLLTKSIAADRSFWGEAAKLAAQLAGAYLIAKVTVAWALRRFKSEKLWERQLQAVADLISALVQMRSAWSKQLTTPPPDRYGDNPIEKQERDRRREETQKAADAAVTRLTDAMSMVRLLLPGEATKIIEGFMQSIGHPPEKVQTWTQQTNYRIQCATDAIETLVKNRDKMISY